MDIKDRLTGAFVGLAIGDAVGTTVEFRIRDTFEPITDMVGKGPFNLPVGYYTDDTSMALCLAESLIEYPLLDKTDLLSRFSRWYHYGENSSTGVCFDIGATTSSAIRNYDNTGSTTNNTEPWNAGNGSIMRLAPATIKYYHDVDTTANIAIAQGETTHAALECEDSCDLLARILVTAYNTDNKKDIFNIEVNDNWEAKVKEILTTLDVTRDEVKSSGYVIDTLHAALWSFKHTDNFRDAILLATNLGGDADTVAAVTGQIAGAFYGMKGIPNDWLEKLHQTERFIELVDKLTNE